MRNSTDRIAVWDPFVRTFHWTLVASYAGAWATAENWDGLHEQLGYFVLAMIGLRLVWGLVGTRHARFTDFLRTPRTTAAYLRSLAWGRPEHYTGHNPAGGWMVILLLASLVAAAGSGILIANGGEYWEELHEAAAGFSVFLIVVHVSGVIVSSLAHRENLVAAMLSGYKQRRNHHA